VIFVEELKGLVFLRSSIQNHVKTCAVGGVAAEDNTAAADLKRTILYNDSTDAYHNASYEVYHCP